MNNANKTLTTFNRVIIFSFIVNTPLYDIIKLNWRRSPISSLQNYLSNSVIKVTIALNKFIILIRSFFVEFFTRNHLLQFLFQYPTNRHISLDITSFTFLLFIYFFLCCKATTTSRHERWQGDKLKYFSTGVCLKEKFLRLVRSNRLVNSIIFDDACERANTKK